MSKQAGRTLGIAKARRLQRLVGPDNRFHMVALDQRAILAQMLAQLKQIEAAELPFSDMLAVKRLLVCLLYTSPSPRDKRQSRMPSSA